MVSVSALIWACAAQAQQTISTAVTTPAATSTASSGAPGDVTVTSDGSVTVTSGAAVTLDSNNAVTNSGAIKTTDAPNTTGILVMGGHSGSVSNGGSITLNESTQPTDSDNDGDLDGPYATGGGRYGVRLVAPGVFTGAISNTAAGTITIQGNDSAAISLETGLQGTLSNLGAISVSGARSYGVHVTAPVSGNVSLMGTIDSTGDAAKGVAIEGDVAGGVIAQGGITVTGYRYTARPLDSVIAKLDADDLLQSGSALTIAGNVGRGLLVDTAPTLSATNADVDGDGIPDATETNGSVFTYGAAPAIVVGAAGRDITLGNVGTGTTAYGAVIKGSVSGAGVYDGVSATGVQIGLAGGGRVDLRGGLDVASTGLLNAQAYGASATGLVLKRGASSPVILNEGTIEADVLGDVAGASAHTIVLEAGAVGGALANVGSIAATVRGTLADAVAFADQSGTVTEIANNGSISATHNGTTVAGRNVAIDVSANTTGVHLSQTTLTGSTSAPAITGDLLFGSGADRVEVLGGRVSGALALGGGANSLNIDGGATVTGALSANGGTVALSVGTGALTMTKAGQINLTSLHLGGASQTLFAIDPATRTASRFDVQGAATLDSGAKIGVKLNSLFSGSQTYVLIRANQLNAGVIDASQLGAEPYIYNATLSTDAAAGTVSVNLGLKSAAAIGLPNATSTAFTPLTQAVGRDLLVQSAVLAQTDRAGFVNLYNQFLPNHSGSVFRMVSASVDGFARPIDERYDPVGGGAWVQELNLGVVGDGPQDEAGYKAYGLGLVGGYELGASPVGIFGLSVGGLTSQIRQNGSNPNQNLTTTVFDGAGYWRRSAGPLSVNARLGADYLRVHSRRILQGLDGDGLQVTRAAAGHWTGLAVNGRLDAAYEIHVGDIYYVRPELNLTYLRLNEGAYTEKGAGDAVNLKVAKRTSSSLSGFAGVAVGAVLGDDKSWGPELLVGYRNVASEQLGATKAKFASGSDEFTVQGNQVGGQGVAAHLSLKGENGSGGFALETGAEMRDALAIYDLRVSAHFQF